MNHQSPPLKNRSGDPFASSKRLGDPTPTPEPHPVDGWHGPLKGPLRPGPCEVSNYVARWHRGQWDFTGWKGNAKVLYLVRKGSPVAKTLGLEPAYPDHTPPELPSPWHRWEYLGTQVSGVQPPWYSVVEDSGDVRTSDIQHIGHSVGLFGFHYFRAVTDAPMLCVNGIWFPEPHREPLELGQSYYLAVPGATDSFLPRRWGYNGSDNRWLASGLIHLTPEAATAHARAMLSLTKGGSQ